MSENRQIYILENLGCAHCASKMENKIKELPQVKDATITFATKQLRVETLHKEDLLPVFQEICATIEPDVRVIPRQLAEEKKKEGPAGKKELSETARDGILIGAGTLFFIGAIVLSDISSAFSIAAFVIAWLILGGEVALDALKGITKGQIFDENFLMTIATLGAFAIHEYPEAVGVMLFFRVGELFEHIAVERSRSQIMDAVDMRPEVVNLVDGNDILTIAAADARIGDIVVVRPGDKIPLDGVIVEGESRLDTSPITGEPVPVKVTVGSEVISGCVNTSGLLKMRVEKTLEHSMVTRILDYVENAAASKPKMDRFITKFARIYTPFVVFMALGTAIIPSLITGNWSYWSYTAITFLVISCPCALVLSVPLAYFSGIGAGSKRGILFKGGSSLEALKDIKAVVMDKTGTITEGNFTVQSVNPSGFVSEDMLLGFAAACESSSTHPIGQSILAAAEARGVFVERPSKVEELSGLGIRAILSGSEVLCGNRKLLEKFSVSTANFQPSSYGTEVLVALNGFYVGHICIADTLKKDSASAIASLKAQGLVTAMLTGDAEESAAAIARETGIDEVHAKLLPQNKVERLGDIRAHHGAVMFVGDGINDAPVLANADVGAAMGSGADAAIEAADVVFMTSSLDAVPTAIRIAKRTSNIAVQNVVFALAIKALVMVLGLAGIANMWLAVFADTGVAMLCILNAIRALYTTNKLF